MGPFRPPPVPRPPARGRTESKAVVSLVLGLMSLSCFGPFLGLPAVVLGSMARRDIDRSGGALGGRALAAGGIVSGVFGTGFGVVIALMALSAVLPSAEDAPSAMGASPPSPVPAATAPAAPRAAAAVPAGVRAYGSLEVVDLDTKRPLHNQLREIVAGAGARKRTVVLQTYSRTSAACDDIASALHDARMQRALANVTLIRVDIDEYERELRQMKVETATAPWFYKLDAKAAPGDAISGAAWDDNVPENMAPVLSKFVARGPRRAR